MDLLDSANEKARDLEVELSQVDEKNKMVIDQLKIQLEQASGVNADLSNNLVTIQSQMVALELDMSQLKSSKELISQELEMKTSSVEKLLLDLEGKKEQMSILEVTCEDLKFKLDECSTQVQNLESNIQSLESVKRQTEEEKEKFTEVFDHLTQANNELKDSLSRYFTVTKFIFWLEYCHECMCLMTSSINCAPK